MQKLESKLNAKVVEANIGRPYFEGIAKKQKGITLIALIITIIVMLILVGVTINVAFNGGLFDTTKEATFKTEVRQIQEALEVKKTVIIAQNGGQLIELVQTNIFELISNSSIDLEISDNLKEKYGSKIGIGKKEGEEVKLFYDNNSDLSETEKEWLREIDVQPWYYDGTIPPRDEPIPYAFTLGDFSDVLSYNVMTSNGMTGGAFVISKTTFLERLGMPETILSEYGVNQNTFQMLNQEKIITCSETDLDSNICGDVFDFFHSGLDLNDSNTKQKLFTFFSSSSNVYLITAYKDLTTGAVIIKDGTENENFTKYDDLLFTFEGTDSRVSVTTNLINITSSNTSEKVARKSTYTTTLSPAIDHVLPNSVEVKMKGETLVAGTDYTYSSETGELTINNVTGDIEITGEAIKKQGFIFDTWYVNDKEYIKFSEVGNKKIMYTYRFATGGEENIQEEDITEWTWDRENATISTIRTNGTMSVTYIYTWVADNTIVLSGEVDGEPTGTEVTYVLAGSDYPFEFYWHIGYRILGTDNILNWDEFVQEESRYVEINGTYRFQFEVKQGATFKINSITMNDNELSTGQYSFENNLLIIPNVSGPVNIEFSTQ